MPQVFLSEHRWTELQRAVCKVQQGSAVTALTVMHLLGLSDPTGAVAHAPPASVVHQPLPGCQEAQALLNNHSSICAEQFTILWVPTESIGRTTAGSRDLRHGVQKTFSDHGNHSRNLVLKVYSARKW